MKRYIATWYNYIAQGQQDLFIHADYEDEARMTAVALMDAQHPHMTHTEDDIDSLTCLDDDYVKYTSLEEAVKLREAAIRERKQRIQTERISD